LGVGVGVGRRAVAGLEREEGDEDAEQHEWDSEQIGMIVELKRGGLLGMLEHQDQGERELQTPSQRSRGEAWSKLPTVCPVDRSVTGLWSKAIRSGIGAWHKKSGLWRLQSVYTRREVANLGVDTHPFIKSIASR
jgi:hypothetical protein